jgi:hypothetical protein
MSPPAPPASDAPTRFGEIVRAGLPRVGWRIQRAGVWTHVAPHDAVLPDQGWKVHLSAVPSSAALVLERVAPLLAEAGCSFKFAASPAEVARLTGRHADRGSAGKFLTVYPPDDSVLPDLVRAMDEATVGLDGPRILSDRPCRPGSLVHFRYGGFVRRLRLAANGVYEAVVAGPDGTWVTDRRDAWFSPPPWAPSNPFAEPPTAPAAAPGGVLIDDRFLLRGAIRHANKGGTPSGVQRTSVPTRSSRRPSTARTGSAGRCRPSLRTYRPAPPTTASHTVRRASPPSCWTSRR